MEPGSHRRIDKPEPVVVSVPEGGRAARPGWLRQSGLEETLGMVVTGPAGAGRRALLADLVNVDQGVLVVPEGAHLVIRHARTPIRAAYVPGYRQPHGYGADQLAVGPALARPPRRVELGLDEPLLRHLTLLDTPDTGELGLAGARIVRDAACRAGGLLFVIAADQTFAASELELLADAARNEVTVFFVVTPGAAGWPTEPPEGDPYRIDPVAVAVDAHRATLLAAVPSLAPAAWSALTPFDVGQLRNDLVGWAVGEGLRRASSSPPVAPGTDRRVPVAVGVEESDWSAQLDRQVRCLVQRVRQHLALELANIHLRVVQEIVFGSGCAGLPQVLDREVHALSLAATAECDLAVARIIADSFDRVFDSPMEEGVRLRINRAVRFGLREQLGDGTARVFLVTSTGGVADLAGVGAIDALDAYVGAQRHAILPPVAVALSGGCYQHWRTPGNGDVSKARSWAQRAVREIELELLREVTRRFEAVRVALNSVLVDAVEHGILLA